MFRNGVNADLSQVHCIPGDKNARQPAPCT
jgi:hypothetical protein